MLASLAGSLLINLLFKNCRIIDDHTVLGCDLCVVSKLLSISSNFCTTQQAYHFHVLFSYPVDIQARCSQDMLSFTTAVYFQISSLGSVYHLVHENTERRSRRSAEDILTRLLSDPNVCIQLGIELLIVNLCLNKLIDRSEPLDGHRR